MDWYDGLTIGKIPDAVLDYQFDWANWLGTDTITSYAVTVQTGLTLDSDGNTDTTVTVWLSGGTLDESYNVECKISTAGGRTEARDITIDCGEPAGKVLLSACP